MHEFIILLGGAFGGPIALALLCSGQWRHAHALKYASLAFVVLGVSMVGLFNGSALLPPSALTKLLQHNWVGKVLSLATFLLVFALMPAPMRREAGILTRPRPPEWRSVLAVSTALLLLFWTIAYVEHDAPKLTVETLLYQASMPGVDEEVGFRGVLLALLVTAFGKPWRVLGIQLGWGALPIVAFFGLAHGFVAGADFSWFQVAVAGATGAALLWIKERTGSIWIAVLVHNLANIGSQIAGA
jgi:MFS family permease